MKKILSTFALIFFTTYATAADLYKVDGTHANIIWKANHFGFSSPSGKFSDVSGTITLDNNNPRNSNVDITINTKSLITGNDKFDTHLKSSDFFNVKEFPVARFVSSSITPTGLKTANIRGEFTLLGVTKMITLNAKLNKIGESPINHKKTAGFSASTTIKRSDFGMGFGLPGIANKIDIDIELEATFVSSTEEEAASKRNRLVKVPTEPKIPSWSIIPEKSSLEFKAMREESPIRGSFSRFDGDINFNKNALSQSNVKIEIDTTSIETSFSGALSAVKGKEWLSTQQYSRATFEADSFTPDSGKDAFKAKGILTIKGRKVRTIVDFQFKEYSETKAVVVGSTTIRRSQFGIGNRNPRKADGVENDVEITFKIEAER